MFPGWVELPDWLVAPVGAVFADIQGDDPNPDLRLLVSELDQSGGVLLDVFDADGSSGGCSLGIGVSPHTDPLVMTLTVAVGVAGRVC